MKVTSSLRRRLPAAMVFASLTAGALAGSSAASAAVLPQFTPISTAVVAAPDPVVGSDGRMHLVYEIAVQNRGRPRLGLRSLSVGARGSPLLPLRASKISGVRPPPATATNTLAAGEGGTIWLDVRVRGRIPRRLVHRFT